MRVTVNQQLFGEFADFDVAQAALSQAGIDPTTAQYACSTDEARRLCAAHIVRHYPDYAQLNILRAGTEAEKAAMSTFIDACREWSNGETPAPATLEAIQP